VLKRVKFPSEEFLMSVVRNAPHAITTTSLTSEKRTPKVRAAIKYQKGHGSLNGFVYTPPVDVPVSAAPARAARVAAAPRERPAGAEGFATRVEHARHIIANRTAADTRQSLIDDVGMTPAGAATYYYNLTRAAPVAEGDEELSLFRSTLRQLGQPLYGA
jgi:hypothetical protein